MDSEREVKEPLGPWASGACELVRFQIRLRNLYAKITISTLKCRLGLERHSWRIARHSMSGVC